MVRPNVPPPSDTQIWAAAKAAIVGITLELQGGVRANQPLSRLCDSGFRIFSQFEEDGYLLYLAAVLELASKLRPPSYEHRYR